VEVDEMSSNFAGVVVGFDGSAPSTAALDWATAEAVRRGLPLKVVLAVELGAALPMPMDSGAPWAMARIEAAAREVLDDAVDRARKTDPGLVVESALVIDTAAAALVAASRSAALVVVGNRGHGDLVSTLLGSVAFGVTAHSQCPVAVVRGGSTRVPGPAAPVVVGVDGSPASDAAVDEACELADRSGAHLQVLAAYQVPVTGWVGTAPWLDVYPEEELADAAEGTAKAVLARARERVRRNHPTLEVEFTAVRERPADALAERSRTAGVVVVGSRGRGGFRSLVLGSVSRGLVHLAESPVLVVHAPDDAYFTEA
jgi:nucleotide-binding universal stress UspA family protein